jgi:hypothetical protein
MRKIYQQINKLEKIIIIEIENHEQQLRNGKGSRQG